jgi:hypothetical protein
VIVVLIRALLLNSEVEHEGEQLDRDTGFWNGLKSAFSVFKIKEARNIIFFMLAAKLT